EYSEYSQNFNGGANEGLTCLNDPVFGTGPYTGCKVPIQYYEYHTNPQRWSNELGFSSLPANEIYAYTTRSSYLQTTEFANISFDITNKLNVEAGVVHFHSGF